MKRDTGNKLIAVKELDRFHCLRNECECGLYVDTADTCYFDGEKRNRILKAAK